MNTVDDLRRTLEDHAGLAPDERGLIEDARTGAARIRRRRRVTAAAGTAAAVIVSALVVPFAVRHESAPPITPPTPPASTTPSGQRQGSDLSVGFAPDAGLTLTSYYLDIRMQSLAAVRDDGTTYNMTVSAPGSFGDGPIEGSERVRVGDQDAWYLARPAPRWMYAKPTTEHLLTWETRDGFGVTFSSVSGKADLLATARAIRFVRPAPPIGPLQLGWVPDGLVPSSAEAQNEKRHATVRLSEPGRETPGGTAVDVRIGPTSPGALNPFTQGKPPTHTVAGHEAWYRELQIPRAGATQAILVVAADDCVVNVQATGPVDFASLVRVVEEATIGSCTDQDGWGPVVR